MIEGKIQWGLINENVFLADLNIDSNRYRLLQVAGHRGACSRFQLRPIMPSGTTAKNPLQERPEAGARKVTRGCFCVWAFLLFLVEVFWFGLVL